MSSLSKSGIQTSADGNSYIPASKRADGSTRKEIRVRPGYRPPEDVETYKNRSAQAWKNRGSGGVPGVEATEKPEVIGESKSKNAKRREAARRKQDAEELMVNGDANVSTDGVIAHVQETSNNNPGNSGRPATDPDSTGEAEAERQKKIRNQLKKLRAVRDLKGKKAKGEKLSPDQLMKVSKEEELIRDLKKLNYDGSEITSGSGDIDVKEDGAG